MNGIAGIASGDSRRMVIFYGIEHKGMGTETPTNVWNGHKGLRTLLVVLALLLVPTVGMVAAEKAATSASLENETKELVGVDHVFLGLDGENSDLDEDVEFALEVADVDLDSEQDSGLTVADALDLTKPDLNDEDDALELANVIVVVYTDGDTAYVIIILIYEDGSWARFKFGPMDLDWLREALSDFDGIVVVIWTGGDDDSDNDGGVIGPDENGEDLLLQRILHWMRANNITVDDLMQRCPLTDDIVGNEDSSDWSQGQAFACRVLNYLRTHWGGWNTGGDDTDDTDDESGCPGGLLAGRWSANDDGQGGVFRGVLMNDDGETIGYMFGQYNDHGQFRGEFTARGGSIIGTLGGTYNNGTFHGEWSTADGELNGVLRGNYLSTEAGVGVFRGQWKMDCSTDPVPMPKPVPPMIICKKVTITTEVIRGADAVALDFENATVKTVVKVVCKKVIPYGDDVIDCKRCGDGDDVRPKPKPVRPTKTDAGQGGYGIDSEDAEQVAAGAAVGGIPLLGISLLRRKLAL